MWSGPRGVAIVVAVALLVPLVVVGAVSVDVATAPPAAAQGVPLSEQGDLQPDADAPPAALLCNGVSVSGTTVFYNESGTERARYSAWIYVPPGGLDATGLMTHDFVGNYWSFALKIRTSSGDYKISPQTIYQGTEVDFEWVNPAVPPGVWELEIDTWRKPWTQWHLDLEVDGGCDATPPPEATFSCSWLTRWANLCDAPEADPVSTRSGIFHESFTDLVVPTRGAGLAVRRGYSTLHAAEDGPFGYGWSSGLSQRLLLDDPGPGVVGFVSSSGTVTRFFEVSGSDAFVAPGWVDATLERVPDPAGDTYELRGLDGRVLVFDDAGVLASATDRNGYEVRYLYGPSGDLETIRDVGTGLELAVAWDAGRVDAITDPAGRVVDYGYNVDGELEQVVGVDGGVWYFEYDDDHRMTRKRDPVQSAALTPADVVNEYDAQGRLWRQTDPEGGVATFDYDSIPGATKVTLPGAGDDRVGASPVDRVRVHEYVDGRRVRTIDGYGTAEATSTRVEYDARTGGITAVVLESVTPERTVYTATYDDDGNLRTEADALGRSTSYADHDAFGQPRTIERRDAGGAVQATTTNAFDAAGNLQSSTTVGTDGTTASTSYAYDPVHAGQVASMTDTRANTWTYGYDAYGRQTSITSPATAAFPNGTTTSRAFDVAGRLLWTRSAKGNDAGYLAASGKTAADFTTTYGRLDGAGQFDPTPTPSGRPEAILAPTGLSTVGYDALGRVEHRVDADGKRTNYAYDGLGRTTAVTRGAQDPATASSQLTTYWPDGSVRSQTDDTGAGTTYGYDVLGRLVAQTDALGNTTAFDHHPDGTLAWRQDPGGDCTAAPPVDCVTYTSDDAGQLATVTYSDPATPDITASTYDWAGRRTSVTSTAGTTTWTYDDLGRLTSTTEGGRTTGYGWDGPLLETIDYPHTGAPTASVTRGYDEAGRWLSVTDWNDDTYTFTPDANGNVVDIDFPGAAGQHDVFSFDDADRMVGAEYHRNGAAHASLTWGRSDAGRLDAMAQGGLPGQAADTYGYDGQGQLTGADGTTFVYDDAENLTVRNGFATQVFNDANQLCGAVVGGSTATCDTLPATATTYGYDDRGNRTSAVPPDSAGPPSAFGYDQENRLTSATVPTFTGNQGEFTPVDATRVADTRTGSGLCPGTCGPLAPGATITVALAGQAGLPDAWLFNAAALQVTAESTSGDGAVLVYSADKPDEARTVSSTPEAPVSVSVADGESATAGVISKTSGAGSVKITNVSGATVDVMVDVAGWYAAAWGASGGTFEPLDPARVFDTDGTPVPAGATVAVPVTGQGGVPVSGVGSVAATLTVEGAGADGRVVAYSSDLGVPPSGTTVTARVGESVSALAQVEVGADGAVLVHNASAGPVAVSVDVSGWYSTSEPSNPEGGGFVPRDPTSVLGWTSVTGGAETTVDVSAVLWNPSEITAVAVTVTAEGAAADGSVKVWAASGGEPGEPVVVSYVAGSASSNTTVLAYDPSGDIRVEASSDAVVKVDVVGYWLGARRTVGYGYAPDGLRLSKTQHTGTTSFHWDRASGLPLLLEERAGWFVTRYVYGPGGLPLAQHRTGGAVELFHHDQLGSTRVVTSAADGSTVAAFTFDAWGSVAASSGSVGVVRHGYAGQYTDAETGLQYLRARYYDPTTGTFLTRDPITALTRSPYGYVHGDPLNHVDPSGLWEIGIPEWVSPVASAAGIDCLGSDCDSIAEQNPAMTQGVVDFSSGVLEVNPITATTNALGLSDTSQHANVGSGWFNSGVLSMAVFNAAYVYASPGTATALAWHGGGMASIVCAQNPTSDDCGVAAFTAAVGGHSMIGVWFDMPSIRSFYNVLSALMGGYPRESPDC